MYAYFMGRRDEEPDDELTEANPKENQARMSAAETAELWQLCDYDPDLMNGYTKEELLACLQEQPNE